MNAVPTLTFVHPGWGWLALLLPLLWWRVRPGVTMPHKVLRTAVFACIIAALTQPGLVHRSDMVRRVFVLDQKTAMSDAARLRARQVVAARRAALPARDPVTVVQLGGAPVAIPGATHVQLDEGAGGGSLSIALAGAVAAIPVGAGGAVTLVSDGLSADRHWARSVDALIRRGIPVDTVALQPKRMSPFISDVRTAPARAGERVQASVTVEGWGDGLTVTLSGNGRTLAASPPVSVRGIVRVPLSFTAAATPFMPVRAVLTGPGADARPFETAAAIQDPLRLLYLGERQAGAGARLQTLLGAGFRVDAPPPGAAVTADLDRYAAVMIDDLPAARLSAPVQQRLLQAVERRGTGLFYAGGRAAFGMGGYDRTPIAAALPVTYRQTEQIRKPSVGVAVVIDSSGSMEGEPMQLAKQIAQLAIRELTPQDQAGVVEFYGARQWAVPMQPVSDPRAIERAIGRMRAQGSSVLLPAMQEAYYGLKAIDTRFKHVIVISDGDVSDGAFEQLIRHMAADRITVSTVMIRGEPRDYARMMDWARWGRGRFYPVSDEYGLVQIDLSPPQTQPVPGYAETRVEPRVRAGHDWWRDLTVGTPPPLAGFVRVDVRPDAETMLAGAGGEPLVASWLYGRGRVTAMMTEPLGAGTRGWAAWPRYGEWLARTITRTADPAATLAVTTQRAFDTLTIAVQRTVAGSGTPRVTLSGRAGPVSLVEKAPGLFAGSLPYPAARTALIDVRDGAAVQRAVDRAYSDTSGGRPPSLDGMLPLGDLAALTGGKAGDASAAARDAGQRGRGDVVSLALWSWLALAALLLYLAELAYRRWPRRVGVVRG